MGQIKRKKKKKRGCLWTIFWILFFVILIEILAGAVIYRGKIAEEAAKYLGPKVPYQEVSIEEEVVEQKYYYDQLEEKEKIVYKEILQGIEDLSGEIYIHSSDAKRTNEIFERVLMDNPDVFWCDGTAKTTHYEGKEEYTVLEPVYSCTEEEKEERQEEIELEAEIWLEGITDDASDYDKILYVFEYIVNTVEYDAEAEDNQNIYSVFAHKRSVCAGYSKAAQYLLEQLDVFCTYVTGVVRSGESHAWNLVICEGDYYYVDTTWGDPVFLSSAEAIANDYISYDYLCCNDKELLHTHKPDADLKLPECTKMDFNYYVMNGLYYEEYDSKRALKEMNDTISQKKNPSVFKFADSESYEEAHKDIFGKLIDKAAQNLAGQYNLKQVKYTYMDDPELNKIVIYWQYE
ncbi:MAG: hypothetical protein HFH03_10650 [Dorea sp.]|jgi:hypothetical protein|nr:hypothetical protein [Dorea sp.]